MSQKERLYSAKANTYHMATSDTKLQHEENLDDFTCLAHPVGIANALQCSHLEHAMSLLQEVLGARLVELLRPSYNVYVARHFLPDAHFVSC